MKIEKINENQIRCTLTRADLAARHLKLSELAYGTEKAKNLFRDMIRQASFDFGFESDDLPLMIEAIPASSDSLVLIITKVEDPEELDTRFSKFTPFDDSDTSFHDTPSKANEKDDLLELLDKVKEAAAGLSSPDTMSEDGVPAMPQIRLFSFEGIDKVISVAKLVAPFYYGANALYYKEDTDSYILALTLSEHSESEFVKVCNMLSEYAAMDKVSGITLAYLEEHWNLAIADHALQQLSEI